MEEERESGAGDEEGPGDELLGAVDGERISSAASAVLDIVNAQDPRSFCVLPKGVVRDLAFGESAPFGAVGGMFCERELPSGVFRNRLSLLVLALGAGVAVMASSALASCMSLEHVSLPGVTSIGRWAFCRCSALVSVEFGSGLRSIGKGAFEGCVGLLTLTIPARVSEIGESAFTGCSRLTSVHLPAWLRLIGDRAFAGCSQLQTIVFTPSEMLAIGGGVWAGCDAVRTLRLVGTPFGNRCFDDAAALVSGLVPRLTSIEPIGLQGGMIAALTKKAVRDGTTQIFQRLDELIAADTPDAVAYVELPWRDLQKMNDIPSRLAIAVAQNTKILRPGEPERGRSGSADWMAEPEAALDIDDLRNMVARQADIRHLTFLDNGRLRVNLSGVVQARTIFRTEFPLAASVVAQFSGEDELRNNILLLGIVDDAVDGEASPLECARAAGTEDRFVAVTGRVPPRVHATGAPDFTVQDRLIEAAADGNWDHVLWGGAPDPWIETALGAASAWGDGTLVDFLTEAQGETVLSASIQQGNTKVLDFVLESFTPTLRDLNIAIRVGNFDAISKVMEFVTPDFSSLVTALEYDRDVEHLIGCCVSESELAWLAICLQGTNWLRAELTTPQFDFAVSRRLPRVVAWQKEFHPDAITPDAMRRAVAAGGDVALAATLAGPWTAEGLADVRPDPNGTPKLSPEVLEKFIDFSQGILSCPRREHQLKDSKGMREARYYDDILCALRINDAGDDTIIIYSDEASPEAGAFCLALFNGWMFATPMADLTGESYWLADTLVQLRVGRIFTDFFQLHKHDNAAGFRTVRVLDMHSFAGPELLPTPSNSGFKCGVEQMISRVVPVTRGPTKVDSARNLFQLVDFVNAHPDGRRFVNHFTRDERTLQMGLFTGGWNGAERRLDGIDLEVADAFDFEPFAFPLLSTRKVRVAKLMLAFKRTHSSIEDKTKFSPEAIAAISRNDLREIQLQHSEVLAVVSGAYDFCIFTRIGKFAFMFGMELLNENDTFASMVTIRAIEIAMAHDRQLAPGGTRELELRGLSRDRSRVIFTVWPLLDFGVAIDELSQDFQDWLWWQPVGDVDVAPYVQRLDIAIWELLTEDELRTDGCSDCPGRFADNDGFSIAATGLEIVLDPRFGRCLGGFGVRPDVERFLPLTGPEMVPRDRRVVEYPRHYKGATPLVRVASARDGARDVRNARGASSSAEYHRALFTIDAITKCPFVAGVASACLARLITTGGTLRPCEIARICDDKRRGQEATRTVVQLGLRVFPDAHLPLAAQHIGLDVIHDRCLIADIVFATRNVEFIRKWGLRIPLLDDTLPKDTPERKRALTVGAGRIALGILVPDAVDEFGQIDEHRLALWLGAIRGLRTFPDDGVGPAPRLPVVPDATVRADLLQLPAWVGRP